jgi:RNA polymerase sigma-70 factor (ECF subfamily)
MPVERNSARTSDAALIQAIAEGDLNALGLLYDKYAPDLLVFTQRLCGAGNADDLVQNVFLRALKVAKTFDPRATSAKPWLFGITLRVEQERRRSLRRWAAALVKLGQIRAVQFRSTHEANRDIQQALLRVSTGKREAFLLVELEGFSCAEAAEILGIPVGTVWTRLHHARRELRANLEGLKL